MTVLSALLAQLMSRALAWVSGKSVTISVDMIVLAVAAGCGLGLWFGTTTAVKVMAAVLAADGLAGYLAFTGRLPGVDGLLSRR